MKRYPFKFLDSYTRSDSDFFFGRDEEVKALYEMVFQSDLILIFGASGTGKTSLIQCGLASKFQTHDRLVLNIRRSLDINQSLESALNEALGDYKKDKLEFSWLEEELDSTSGQMDSILTKQFKAIYLRYFKPLYLIFDQFEELYILGTKEEQDKFIKTVKAILLIEQPIKIIISIREEYLGYLYEFERRVPELLRKKLRVEPMNLDKVNSVIDGISKSGNSLVKVIDKAEAFSEKMFNLIKGNEKSLSIPLPYLQVFLDKLYLQITGDHERLKEAEFSVNDLLKLDNIGDILRDFLDEQVLIIAHYFDQKVETIWGLLSPFVTLEGTKEPLSKEQLSYLFPNIGFTLIESILEYFVKSRILRFSEKSQFYEIAHDALAQQIHNKRSDEEVSRLEIQRLIRSQTSLKESSREFYSEKQLLLIEPHLNSIQLNESERQWIFKSRDYLEQQKLNLEQKRIDELESTKKRLRLVRGLLVVAAIALLLALYSFYSTNEKNKALEQANLSLKKAETARQLSQNKLEQVELEKEAKIMREMIQYANDFLAVNKCQLARKSVDSLEIMGSRHPELNNEIKRLKLSIYAKCPK